MMEGVAGEAASLAGHLQLSNLCWIYDNNHVTLDGPASWSFSEDVMTRFVGYGWNVTRVADANDLMQLSRGYKMFLKTTDRPTLIVVDSHIGYGSPHKQDSYEAHGEPLGEAEVKLAKKIYGWPEDAKFLVPDGVYDHFQDRRRRARRQSARRMEQALRGVLEEIPGSRRPAEQHAESRASRRLGQESPRLSRRPQRHGHARKLRQSAERAGAEYSVADRRLGGPRQIQQDQSDLRRRRRFLPRRNSRAATSTSACANTPWARRSTA